MMALLTTNQRIALASATSTVVLLLAACSSGTGSGGGSGDLSADAGTLGSFDAATTDGSTSGTDGGTAATYSIGGTITGYTGGSLVLETNGESLPVAKGASSFTFPTKRPSGTAYDVKVKAQPTEPSQTCEVASGSGKLGTSDAKNVQITCTTNTYPIEVTVAGLKGTVVLTNNGGDDLSISSAVKGTFSKKVASGAAYDVAIKTQPANQVCSVMSPKGTVVAGTVTVTVNCVTNSYALGGTVSGLEGQGLVLQNNAGGDLTVNANGAFAFAAPVEQGAAYAVTVKTNPSNKWQTCTVTNGSGTMGGAAVNDVQIACTTNAYKVGGTVNGLANGQSIELTNGAEKVTASAANNTFEFPTSVLSGDTYDVKVVAQPTNPWLTCAVANNADTMKGANVSLVVTCTVNKYKVGGTLYGLPAATSIVLQNNAGDDLAVNASGAFSFATSIDSGSAYAVTIKTQPAGKVCTLANATGNVAGADVTSVQVVCGASGQFAVNEGPVWYNNPPSYSCLDACALKFGGAAADYACSTSATSIDHQAWLDGWGTMQYCGNTPAAEDFKKSVNYDCGGTACSFSAYVSDHGCSKVNYCFKK